LSGKSARYSRSPRNRGGRRRGKYLPQCRAGAAGMDRVAADYMGMLATIIECAGASGRHAARRSERSRAVGAQHRGKCARPTFAQGNPAPGGGRIVIFAAGTGNPFFNNRYGGRASRSEIGAEIVLKAPRWTGCIRRSNIYPDAKRYTRLSFDEAISRNLRSWMRRHLRYGRDQKLPMRYSASQPVQ